MKRMCGPRAFYRLLSDMLINIRDMREAGKAGRVSCEFSERIMMAVTEVNGCLYCSYFHTQVALKAGMDLWDHDRYSYDDRQCRAEYVYYPRDIEEIAKLPGRSKTYTRHFSEYGGGFCRMQYTIDVLPAVLPPGFMGDWEDYEIPPPAVFTPAD